MNKYSQLIQIRWADIDANRHLRHSVYYDYAASVRISLLNENGLSMKKLEALRIGPVLFREEAIFKREILFEDKLEVTTELTKATEDYSRWSFRHHYIKNDDVVAAIVNVDGAWIDLDLRKLAVPSSLVREIFDNLPKASDFTFISSKNKT